MPLIEGDLALNLKECSAIVLTSSETWKDLTFSVISSILVSASKIFKVA